MKEELKYNPEKNYESEYYESLIVLTPYGKAYVTIRSNSMLSFDYAKRKFFSEFEEKEGV